MWWSKWINRDTFHSQTKKLIIGWFTESAGPPWKGPLKQFIQENSRSWQNFLHCQSRKQEYSFPVSALVEITFYCSSKNPFLSVHLCKWEHVGCCVKALIFLGVCQSLSLYPFFVFWCFIEPVPFLISVLTLCYILQLWETKVFFFCTFNFIIQVWGQ